ncbi:alpha/beta hydrolase [Marivivens sp. LCG002]|uniref:alpha/beta hydrolase n=1 Tax=Marivivens sp. LCG002 TaxID=3051171 RepID=UPI002554B4C1|nr:alpha/beta hydrolase [Marivivens sp. LCG002]WIV50064.1 alpha/beta hydrolase [Marivivens sp. LCG002]
MMTAEDALIWGGERLRLYHVRNGGSRLIVSFDFRQTDRKGFNPPDPSKTFAEAGFDQLSLRVARNDWFINRETETAEALMAGIAANYDAVQMIGYSMGGYGAFRFARAVGARAVLAISPQFSIHPRIVPFEKRYHEDAGDFDPDLGDLTSRAVPGLVGVMLVDTLRPRDLRHARMLQAVFPKVRIARVMGGGHPATEVMAKAGVASIITREAVNTPPSLAALTGMHRSVRRSSPLYLGRLAKAASTGHLSWATDLERMARAAKAVK